MKRLMFLLIAFTLALPLVGHAADAKDKCLEDRNNPDAKNGETNPTEKKDNTNGSGANCGSGQTYNQATKKCE